MSAPPDLGPLPEPVARMSPDGKSLIRDATYVYGVKSGDELFSRVNGFTVTLHTSDQTRDFGQRCYMLGVAAERERCIAWVRYWLTGAKPAMTTDEYRCLFSLSGNGYAPLPYAPTKEGG